VKVLITGADGFIGRNLRQHLGERGDIEVVCFTREHALSVLEEAVRGVDVVFHLLGVNRPEDPTEFVSGNVEFTYELCQAVARESAQRRHELLVVYTSSTQAARDNPYGLSKLGAERVLADLAATGGSKTCIFRLPNVFGKWSRPNYNSAVATFCHNTARGLPIQVNDPSAKITLVYIDDVIKAFVAILDGKSPALDQLGFANISPQYKITVGELAERIRTYAAGRSTLMLGRVGAGFERALYATYVSFLPLPDFSYPLPTHADSRGAFVEIFKTPDCGQLSFFTCPVGVTRGGHYHHTKTERFLVVKGHARFKFRHVQTGEIRELDTHHDKPEVVITVPGWAHDITNVGDEEMVVVLWANEVFEREKPDTYSFKL